MNRKKHIEAIDQAVIIDFKRVPKLYNQIVKLAENEFRTVEQQILYLLKGQLQNDV